MNVSEGVGLRELSLIHALEFIEAHNVLGCCAACFCVCVSPDCQALRLHKQVARMLLRRQARTRVGA